MINTVSESTAMSFIPRQYYWDYRLYRMSFIPRQYSWDYRHERERRKLYAVLHLFCQTNLSTGQTTSTFPPNFAYSLYRPKL